MELAFDNQLDEQYDFLEGEYASLMATAFELLSVSQYYEVDVSLVDDETIHQINRDYRHIDRVTDVISFAFLDDDSEAGRINGDIPRLLGEIFICVPQALRQAKEIGNTDMRELRFLFTHGLLHLLGYDHMEEDEKKVMRAREEEVLSAIGVDRRR